MQKTWPQLICLSFMFCSEAYSSSGNDILKQARSSLSAGQYQECWRLLDLVSSNFPDEEPEVSRIRQQLDSRTPERAGRVSVATWLEARECAVSITFDDSHGAGVADELGMHGWPATFYLTNLDGRLKGQVASDLWSDVAGWGHEIGNHTDNHPPDLPALPAERIEKELLLCNDIIAGFTDDPIRSFAYPRHDFGPLDGPLRTKVRGLFVAARGGMMRPPQDGYRSTPDFMDAVHGVPMGSSTKPHWPGKWLDDFRKYRGWFIAILHGVDKPDPTGPGFEPVTPEVWQKTIEGIERIQNVAWVGSFADVAEYVIARRSADVTSAIDDRMVSVSVECDIPQDRVRIPLTVTVRLPDRWTSVRIDDHIRNVRDHKVTLSLLPNSKPRNVYRVTP